jgi:BMFP domain-containing protein YqiC
MSEAVFRFTLAEVEAHRKELADARHRAASLGTEVAHLTEQLERCNDDWRKQRNENARLVARVAELEARLAREHEENCRLAKRIADVGVDAHGRRFWDGTGRLERRSRPVWQVFAGLHPTRCVTFLVAPS